MIKGVKVQATNSNYPVVVHTAAGFASGIPLMTVPSGKTFVLTDLTCGFLPSTSTGSGMMLPGIALGDMSAANAGTIATAGNVKVCFRPEINNNYVGLTDVIPSIQIAKPLIITDLVNGPEFTTCVTAISLGTWTVPTYGLWVGGILR